ncbi:MAG: hypothetical protein M1812_004519 [Candelaria pacifica]|nr:MAG: hypothetical protein M1812_004519 [Candelaria pacifica]
MSTDPTQSTVAYPKSLPNVGTLLPTPLEGLHNPLSLEQYVMNSDARNHGSQAMLQPYSGQTYQNTGLAAVPPSSFANIPNAFQSNTRDTLSSETGVDGHFAPPKEHNRSLGEQEREAAVAVDASPGRISATSIIGDRSSLGGSEFAAQRNRKASMDESEATSSESFTAQGVRGSPHDSVVQDGLLQPSSANAISEMLELDGSNLKHGDDDHLPSWTELKTKAGKERKRLPLACIACRRKKIRCSGEKPACKHCLRSRMPCVYKVTTRKAAPRTDYMAMLDKRLKRMEERVIKVIPREDSGRASSVGRAVVRPASNVMSKSAGSKKRAAGEAFAQELDAWANSKSRDGAGKVARQAQDNSERDMLTEGLDSLPSKGVQLHLTEVFFDRIYGQTYLLLHKPSFMRRLNADTVPPVLMLAVCAISARFSDHPYLSRSQEPAFLRGEAWARAAREIALRKYDEPSITIITVYLILGLHEFGTCQGGRSWMFGGMAIRMAYALQLHQDLDYDPLGQKPGKESAQLSFTDREIRRRLMWACFLMDRFNSSGTERPSFISDHSIKVPLPIKEQYFQLEIPGPTQTLEEKVRDPIPAGLGQRPNPKENMGVAAYNIRVLALWGRVIQYLNLGGKEKDDHPLWSPQSTFADLKAQSEAFMTSLPDVLQYNPTNLQIHATEKLANQYIFLHIAYHQVVLLMNRFAIPSAPGGRPSKDMPPDFLTKAGHAALEASNHISGLIEECTRYNVVAPFAGYCAFLSSTVHIFGVFSKNAELETASKKNLAMNVKYLSNMKKYWGMFHFMAETLSEIYRQHADAAVKGPNAIGGRPQPSLIFQYGDWFTRYPRGISSADLEDTAPVVKQETSHDAALSQKPDLQSVEDFFSSLSPTSKAKHQKKMAKKESNHNASADNDRLAAQRVINMQRLGEAQPAQLLGSQLDLAMPRPPKNPTVSQQLLHRPQIQDELQQPQQIPQDYQPQYQPDPFLLPVQPQGMLQQLDRQLVYGAYAGMGPSAAASQGIGSNDIDHSMSDNQSIWTQMDLSGLGPGFMNDATSAWFMPFNMEPPEISDDGSGMLAGFGGSYSMQPPPPLRMNNTSLHESPGGANHGS